MYDVVIVGAGVTGCSIARELSKHDMRTCVVEKGSDVAVGTTKANSAIVHAGEDPVPGTLKAKLNVRGNSMFDELSKQLDFPFKRNGSMVLCFSQEDMDELKAYMNRGIENGVPGMKILNRQEALRMEPNLSEEVYAALYLPTGGICCPYEMTIALAENAFSNGVEFRFDCQVENIERQKDEYVLCTSQGKIQCKLLINAAGLHADELNNMVSRNKIKIIPRRGEYCLLDKTAGSMTTRTLFQLPTKMGKGVLVTPTVDGNLLIGPNAEDVEDKNSFATTASGLDSVLQAAGKSIRQVPGRDVITSFCGLRAHEEGNDFIIGEALDAPGFINAAGIESPGLTSAPAMAEMIENIVVSRLQPEKNLKFNPVRKGIPKFREMTNDERKVLIAQDDRYGKIVCRCETVTEGEIVNAIRRPLGARTLDGVKRRTRAGMGRCQAGFCTSRIVDIMARELNVPKTEITKFGGKSNLLVGKDKENV